VPGADLIALGISLRLALITTALLLGLCTPLAWWLGVGQSRLRVGIDALVSLPLVLPPTVLGFYLLLLLGPHGGLGAGLKALGLPSPAFSFTGLVIGSLVYSLPFVAQPLRDAFASIGPRTLEAAATLGAAPRDRFFTVAIPLARRGYLTAAVLAFAHTLGEFGVVFMIGGNIPGRTRTASMAIFDHAEQLDYAAADRLSLTLLGLCLLLLLGVYGANRQWRVAALSA